MNHQETLTAYISSFVDELARSGVEQAVISPGSRSTPVSMLMAKHQDIHIHMNIDERSAGFFALGLAKATKKPVALICTSGTAAVNYFPAIVEAHYSRVPLVVITADRPHELRDVGAPQAIDQMALYGKYVKWFSDVGLPEASPSAIRYIRNISKRAAVMASHHPKGPVHLNIPIREPLIPNMGKDYFSLGREAAGQFHFDQGTQQLSAVALDRWAVDLKGKKQGLIICGELYDGLFAKAVQKLSRALGFPVLADPLSQLRASDMDEGIIDCYDTFLRLERLKRSLKPDVIIRFGAMPVSKALTQYMKLHADAMQIVIDSGNGWREPTGTASGLIYSDESDFCNRLADKIPRLSCGQEWITIWQELNSATRAVLKKVGSNPSMNEGRVFLELLSVFPDDSRTNLFVGNSMPIRDCDTFFHHTDKPVTIYANRGANGIDGVVSTALGVSASGDRTVLVIGDLSFFHDMNGLLASKMVQSNMTIIIINNDGGGIFSFLPQAEEKENFEDLFGTPHGLDYSYAVAMYGGRFERVTDWNQFRDAYSKSLSLEGLQVIEVVTDRTLNVELHRDLWKDVSREIEKIGVDAEHVH
ncbi:MAG: 2-succinyl-5-enolpyruvyl-6-hydroxy-3-cyclohexene-1-carboxylic-acid synthase [Bacillus sp. (in: firmicutes)]